MRITNPADMLTATVSFRPTDDECRTLALRADSEQRTVSQLVRCCYGTCWRRLVDSLLSHQLSKSEMEKMSDQHSQRQNNEAE
jgi:hypothetical protein